MDERITIPARISGEPAYALELSLDRLRVGDQYFIEVGAEVDVAFEWDGRAIELTGILEWSRVQRVGRGASDNMFYEAGVRILESHSDLDLCVEAIRKANEHGTFIDQRQPIFGLTVATERASEDDPAPRLNARSQACPLRR